MNTPLDDATAHAPGLDAILHPLDEHNRALRDHVHPENWTNPVPPGRYNLVVIGGGPAGLVAAAGAAGLGAKVALIERSLLGGDCLNVGCVPSKALIRCAQAAADVRDAARFGVVVEGPPRVDFGAVMERIRRLRAGMSHHDSAARFTGLGVDVFLGEARFDGPRSIQVGDARLHFSKALIATGARASAPPIPGLAEAGFRTNETIFSLTELPPRLAVVGAGPIGCELAQAFARLGARVTLLEADSRILPREEAEAAEIVHRALVRDGVMIVCGGRAAEVRREGAERILRVECHGEAHEIRADEILIGVGRAPNVESLHLEAAGVTYDHKRGVHVDDFLRTSNRHIYAAGDVASAYKFTHAADAQARIVLRNALFFGRDKASALILPGSTYTDPEVAHVGLSEEEAAARGIRTECIRVALNTVDRAIVDGEEEGYLRIVHEAGRDRILGATLVARHAGDMISEITAVMAAGKGLGSLARTIHPYPTRAEIIKKAADAYNRKKLTPRVKKLFETLLAWRR